mmetsp:Transcript_120503/g.335483  ORF Transcript_120503/g.335483 Transcript_120503/m.335483 type:complete len:197 (+) Transcript_120503:51-641(+)
MGGSCAGALGEDVDGSLCVGQECAGFVQPMCFDGRADTPLSNQALLLAAGAGDVEGARRALCAGAAIETRRPIILRFDTVPGEAPEHCVPWEVVGLTPLMRAAQGGHAQLCELLVAGGASVDACDEDGLRPLHFAASAGSEAACRVLLAGGAAADAADDEERLPIDHVPVALLASLRDHQRWVSLLRADPLRSSAL